MDARVPAASRAEPRGGDEAAEEQRGDQGHEPHLGTTVGSALGLSKLIRWLGAQSSGDFLEVVVHSSEVLYSVFDPLLPAARESTTTQTSRFEGLRFSGCWMLLLLVGHLLGMATRKTLLAVKQLAAGRFQPLTPASLPLLQVHPEPDHRGGLVA